MKHVFVWTIDDIFGLIVVGLCLVVFLVILAKAGWEKIKQRWFR